MANTRKLSLGPWGFRNRTIDIRDIETVEVEQFWCGGFIKIILRDEVILSKFYPKKIACEKKKELIAAWNQMSNRCE